MITTLTLSPWNGCAPVRHSCSTQVSAYTSARWVTSPLVNRSGAMYAYVPTAVPNSVSASSVTALAIPKSTRYAKSSRLIRMFSGLTSRCMMPFWCAASSAEATWATIAVARAGVIGPCSLSSLRRSVPSIRRMSTNSSPSTSP